MSIAVRCRHCMSRFSAPESANGKTAHCPKCGSQISINEEIDVEPPVIDVTPKLQPTNQRAPLFRSLAETIGSFAWTPQLLVVGVVVFLVTMRTDSGWGTPIHYVALIGVLWSIATKVASRIKHRLSWCVLVPLIVALVWLWGYFDYRISDWTNIAETGEQWYYTDYTYRGKHRPYYRRTWTYGKENDGIIHLSTEGGFSETGKQHGKWHTSTMYTAEAARSMNPRSGIFHDDDRWYWYGEQVSEGEWHLRNR